MKWVWVSDADWPTWDEEIWQRDDVGILFAVHTRDWQNKWLATGDLERDPDGFETDDPSLALAARAVSFIQEAKRKLEARGIDIPEYGILWNGWGTIFPVVRDLGFNTRPKEEYHDVTLSMWRNLKNLLLISDLPFPTVCHQDVEGLFIRFDGIRGQPAVLWDYVRTLDDEIHAEIREEAARIGAALDQRLYSAANNNVGLKDWFNDKHEEISTPIVQESLIDTFYQVFPDADFNQASNWRMYINNKYSPVWYGEYSEHVVDIQTAQNTIPSVIIPWHRPDTMSPTERLEALNATEDAILWQPVGDRWDDWKKVLTANDPILLETYYFKPTSTGEVGGTGTREDPILIPEGDAGIELYNSYADLLTTVIEALGGPVTFFVILDQ